MVIVYLSDIYFDVFHQWIELIVTRSALKLYLVYRPINYWFCFGDLRCVFFVAVMLPLFLLLVFLHDLLLECAKCLELLLFTAWYWLLSLCFLLFLFSFWDGCLLFFLLLDVTNCFQKALIHKILHRDTTWWKFICQHHWWIPLIFRYFRYGFFEMLCLLY